jgi:hypothetical protein
MAATDSLESAATTVADQWHVCLHRPDDAKASLSSCSRTGAESGDVQGRVLSCQDKTVQCPWVGCYISRVVTFVVAWTTHLSQSA